MPETLSRETFEGRIGERFLIALGTGDDLELVLAEVEGAAAGSLGERPARAFSLTFRGGPRDRHLAQRTYALRHETLGTLDIFLVPLGADLEAMRYQAIFT